MSLAMQGAQDEQDLVLFYMILAFLCGSYKIREALFVFTL